MKSLYNMETIYDLKPFTPEFKKFIRENEFGTSVYQIVYDKELISTNLKQYILKLKFRDESNYEEIVIKEIPPYYMKQLRSVVFNSNAKIYFDLFEAGK